MIAKKHCGEIHQGQYPVEGKATLESAAEDLESLADRTKPVPYRYDAGDI